MMGAHDIIFQQVFPILGFFTGSFMSFAPFRAVLHASRAGSLGDLNPTPFVFMLGNCIGWIAYSYLVQNIFVFLPNAPGVILAIWLNIQAIKLQYENYRSKEMQDALIAALEEQSSKKTFHKREVSHLVESVLADDSLFADLVAPETTAPIVTIEENSTENTLSTVYSAPEIPEMDDGSVRGGPRDEEGTVGEAIMDYAGLVWDIAAQKTPAPASHEMMVVGISTFWLILCTIAAFGHPFLDENSRALMIGIFVNINLLFFYGAPLSKIATVLETKCSKVIHIPTLIASMLNGSLWFFYGVEVGDYFVALPNGLGALLGTVQLVLCLVFPRHRNMEPGADALIYTRESTDSLSLPEESTPLI